MPHTNKIAFALAGLLCLAMNPASADNDKHERTEYSHGKGSFEFALIGDTPYGVLPGEAYAPYDRLVNDINHTRRLQWVMHAGDIKSGSTECSDAMFMDRLERYNQFDLPVILTIGDNEWTDCHRVNNGGYQPLERLAKLREILFSQPGYSIGGERMRVATQADEPGFEEFPENVRWQKQNVVFATMHMVGSNNALKAFDPQSPAVRTQADDDEVARRTAATLAWLTETFDIAEANHAPGVFLMIHANPGLERSLNNVNRTGFEDFLAALEARTEAYGKPVVLAHGDSHYMRVDKPKLATRSLKNFTRVETFGSKNVHWLKVSVNPRDKDVFKVEQEIIEQNP